MFNKFIIPQLFVAYFLLSANMLGQILPLHNYTMKGGLISDNIRSICQDSLGYIWIGTGEGISVFDSKEFHNYSKSDGLTSNSISCIIADERIVGEVWIGTGDCGVDKFIDGNFTNYSAGLSKNKKSVNTLFQDNNYDLWCGTEDGIFIIHKDSIKVISSSVKLGSVNSIIQDKKGNILIGSDRGLFQYSFKDKKFFKEDIPLNKNDGVSYLYKAENGDVWIATFNGYIFKMNSYSALLFKLKSFPHCIVQDSFHNLWISTNNAVYKIFQNHIQNKFTIDNGLLENDINSLLIDKEKILWFGSNDNGLSKLVYQNLIKFQIPKKYIAGNWSSTTADSDNHFWISLNEGLYEVWQDSQQQWHNYFHPFGIINKDANMPTIFCDNNNTLYTAFSSGLIKIYKIKCPDKNCSLHSQLISKEQISLQDKFKFYGIYTIFCDHRGFIWCSAIDLGVVVINPFVKQKILKIYTQKDGIPDNSIRAIFEDSNGNMWFGGYDHGLSEFSNGKINYDLGLKSSKEKIFKKLFTKSNGLPDNGVRVIDENKNKDLLIGTRYGGLAIFKKNKFKIITKTEGLFSNAIWSIAITPAQQTWLGTQSGIQKLNAKNEEPEYFLNEEIPNVPYYSICSSKNGNICFVNHTEIYIYLPLVENLKITPPPVYITSILINGQRQKIFNNLDLASDQNTITFDFIGIINREEKNSSYLYRLLKSDKKWNLLKQSSSITYASLRPGNYTFQVMAINSSSIKSLQPAEVIFKINAPFYLQWWFISILLIFLILTLILTTKLRINRLLEIEKVRTRIAADLHDEIGSGLTKIAILSEYALQDDKKEEKTSDEKQVVNTEDNSVERVGKIARNLVDSMMDVIWAIDPKYDSLQDFVFNFKNYAYEVCEAKNINLQISTKEIENIKINSQIKRCLQLISKEGLNNALKYSQCSTIVYSLSVKSKNIYLKIEDNGIGFDSSNTKYGRGISNMEKLVNELFGSFTFKSGKGEGEGTKFSFIIPLKN